LIGLPYLFIGEYRVPYPHGRLQKIFQGGNIDSVLILFRLLMMQCQWTSQNDLPILHHKENVPCYGNSPI